MSMTEELEYISNNGWAPIEFDLHESERAAYARAANEVISIALDNEEVRQALDFELNPGLERGSVRTGQFGLGYPRNSVDKKVYLHTGYQSRGVAESVMAERNQPSSFKAFWELNEDMLRTIEERTRKVLVEIGANALLDTIFPKDLTRRDVHLRTVRYIDGLSEPVGAEVVSGHADLGLMSWHLYETHGGWLMGAAYSPQVMSAEDSPERRESIKLMRESLKPLTQTETTLPLFLGANWYGFHNVPEGLQLLPSCYHAGFRPSSDQEEVSVYAEEVTDGERDRVSVICFIHPNGDELLLGSYNPATVSQCRPEY